MRTDRQLFQSALNVLRDPNSNPIDLANVATLIERRLAAGEAHSVLADRIPNPRAKDTAEVLLRDRPDLHDKTVRVRHIAVIEGPFPDVARQLGYSVPPGPCSGPSLPLTITIERSDFEVVPVESAPAHELDAMVRSESGHGGS